MDDSIRRLPDAELEVMLCIWHADPPVSASYILTQLHGKRNWALATLMTVLGRLAEKGFVTCEKRGRNNLYSPVVSEEDYKASEGKSLLERLYSNSFHNLVVSLYDSKAISQNDLVELRRYLDRIEGQR